MRDAVVGVAAQLQELWSPAQVAMLFKPVLDAAAAAAAEQQQASSSSSSSPTKGGDGSPRKQGAMGRLFSKSIFSRSARKAAPDPVKIAEARRMAAVCCMYSAVLETFEAEHCTSLLSAIAFTPELVPAVWNFLPTIGPRPPMSVFLNPDARGDDDPSVTELAAVLSIACQLASKLVVTLSNEEIYDRQEPVSLNMMCEISGFLNEYVLSAQAYPFCLG